VIRLASGIAQFARKDSDSDESSAKSWLRFVSRSKQLLFPQRKFRIADKTAAKNA